MNLDLFLSEKNNRKRIVIVSDMKNGNRILKEFERRTGNLVHNVECRTIEKLAMEVFYHMKGQNALGIEGISFLDNSQAEMFFRNILLARIQGLQYFNHCEILNLHMVREIFSKINLMRMNDWREESIENERIKDLELLIKAYEDELSKSKQFDLIELEKACKDYITNNEKNASQLFNADFYFIDADFCAASKLENDFVGAFINDAKNVISLNDVCEHSWADPERTNFFSGYGTMNECNYIVNDIVESKIPYGEVSVLYMSPKQVPFLAAAFGRADLRASFLSGKSAKGNLAVVCMERIFDWALDDFSEIGLEKVFSCPFLYVQTTDEEGDTHNKIGGEGYFKHVLSARRRKENSFVLGWKFERNCEFINHELASEGITEEEEAVLALHRDMLAIFRDVYLPESKIKPGDLYKRMLDFLEKYKNKKIYEYSVIKEQLEDCLKKIRYEEREMKLDEAISFIREVLEGLNMGDDEKADAVNLMQFSSWSCVDRPYLYVVGLALKDFQGNGTQSPIIFDEEMEQGFSGGFVPTIENLLEKKNADLRKTLEQFRGEKLSLGYSNYDITDFCQYSPSLFFLNALKEAGKELSDCVEFTYGNPTDECEFITTIELKETVFAEPIKLNTSNSSIEKFLDCPRKYAYGELLYIPEEDLVEKTYDSWLNAMHFGTFFHRIAEKYAKSELIAASDKAYAENVNIQLLEQIIDDVKAEMIKTVPAAFSGLIDSALLEIRKLCEDYLSSLHASLTSTQAGWRVLATEFVFENVTVEIEDYNKKSYPFVFHGVIDRIDYKVDDSNKTILLRAADYKTGKSDTKGKEIGHGKILQNYIYYKALENCDIQAELREMVCNLEVKKSVSSYSMKMDSFSFVFPKETQDASEKCIEIDSCTDDELCHIRLKTGLTALGKNKKYISRYEICDTIKSLKKLEQVDAQRLQELHDAIYDNDKECLKETETKNCTYCSYQALCMRTRSGEKK